MAGGGSVFVHPTAVVEDGAVIGAGAKIWHFCHVMRGARVGAGAVLGQNVFVGGAAEVGNGCRVQNNVSIYDGVTLEDEVFVGPSAVFTNVARPRAFIDQKRTLRPTRVGRGATIGANATVVCGHAIGAYAFVGAGAVVTRDVQAHALVLGVPASRRAWVCRCATTLAAAPGGGRLACPACGSAYEPLGDGLVTVR